MEWWLEALIKLKLWLVSFYVYLNLFIFSVGFNEILL